MRRAALLSFAMVTCLATCLASAAAAYELRWDGQAPVASSGTSQVCTLSVWSAAADCPLRSGLAWQLVWASQEPGVAFAFLAPPSYSDPVPSPEYRFGDASLGLGGQVDTLVQSVLSEPCSAPVARFQFTFPPNPRVTVALIVESTVGPAPVRIVTALSIGDGPPIPPPPSIARGSGADLGGTSRVVIEGLGFEAVRRAYWISESRNDTTQASVTASTSSRADLHVPRQIRWQPASLLLLVDELGRGVAFPVGALTWEGTVSARPRPVVRFQPHTIDLPSGHVAAPTEALISYREDVREQLASAGVRSLRRLFPDEGTSRGFTTNLVGEPVLADNLGDIYIASLDSTAEPDSSVARLRTLPWVQYAHAAPSRARFFSNDPYWPQQWNLSNTGASAWVEQNCGYPAQAGIDVGALAAWSLTQGSPTTRIGVLDSGVYDGHPDLPAHLVVGPDFHGAPGVQEAHGTNVIGLISAIPDNGEGLAGIAPGVTPVSVKVDIHTIDNSYVAGGIHYCTTEGIPIVSMSWGGPDTVHLWRDMWRQAFERGLLLVAASGNNDNDVPNYPPAHRRYVTAVTAVLPDGRPWRDEFITGMPGGKGNSIGPHVDLTAPAGSFLVTTSWVGGPTYTNLDACQPGSSSGFGHTSAAAPTVAAVAGLLHSYMSSVLSYRVLGEDLARIMELSAVDIVLPPAEVGKDQYSGWGMARADLALAFVAPPRFMAHGAIGYAAGNGTLAVVDSSQNQIRTFLGVPGLTDGSYDSVTVVHLEGTASFNVSFSTPPAFWIRSSGTLGWLDVPTIDRNEDAMDGTLAPGSLTSNGALLRTTLYRIPGYGWFPVEPANARIAYSAVGEVTDLVRVEGNEPRGVVGLTIGANPARGRLTFQIDVPRLGHVRLTVFDVAGREIRRLIDGELTPGRHEIAWEGFGSDGARAGNGVYFCRLEASGENVTRRVAYLRR